MTKDDHINDILKKVRKNIKPAKGPLTSIDPKKLAKASEDVQIAKEIADMVDKNGTEEKEPEKKDK